MKIQTKYSITDIVYLITDKEQEERIITGIIIRPSGVIYYLTNGTTETSHYEMEFEKSKDILKTFKN